MFPPAFIGHRFGVLKIMFSVLVWILFTAQLSNCDHFVTCHIIICHRFATLVCLQITSGTLRSNLAPQSLLRLYLYAAVGHHIATE